MSRRDVLEPIGTLGTVAAMLGVAGMAFAGLGPSRVLAALVAAFVPYALLFGSGPRRAPGLRTTLACVAGVGTALVCAPPALSDDIYRYVWDGRVLLHGIEPYAWAPDAPQLAFLRDSDWHRINHRGVPTIYPPLAQALFAATQAVWRGPRSLKLVALLAHLLTTWWIGKHAGRRGPRAARLYGLNPLVLHEAALSGHVDAVAAWSLLACVVALGHGREGRAAGWAAAASGLKLIGLVLAPWVGRRRARWGLLAVVLAALPLVPLLASPHPTGLGHYVQRWRGNAGGFAVLEAVTGAGVDAVARATGSPPARLRLEPLRPWLQRLQDSAFDPRAAQRSQKKPAPNAATFARRTVASLGARVLAGLCVIGMMGLLWTRRARPVTAARALLLTVLLLAPQVHPWYLLWLLPLEALAGTMAGWVWSATVLVAYVPLERWQLARQWEQPVAARVFEYGLVLAVLAWETPAFRNRLATVARPWRLPRAASRAR